MWADDADIVPRNELVFCNAVSKSPLSDATSGAFSFMMKVMFLQPRKGSRISSDKKRVCRVVKFR